MYEYKFAGFWWRFLAFIIDVLINAGLNTGIGFIIGMGYALFNMNRVNTGNTAMLVAALIGMIVTWLYYTLSESSSWQATIGKKICGLIVVDLGGKRIGFGRANGRYFAKILSALIFYIGFFMIGWTEKKQGLHDMIAGTLVLRLPPESLSIGTVQIPTS